LEAAYLSPLALLASAVACWGSVPSLSPSIVSTFIALNGAKKLRVGASGCSATFGGETSFFAELVLSSSDEFVLCFLRCSLNSAESVSFETAGEIFLAALCYSIVFNSASVIV